VLGVAGDLDGAAMLFEDAVAEREPEPQRELPADAGFIEGSASVYPAR